MKSVPGGRWLAAKRTTFVFVAAVAFLGVTSDSGGATPGDTTRVSVIGSGALGNDGSRRMEATR